jgi:hypothetical protein
MVMKMAESEANLPGNCRQRLNNYVPVVLANGLALAIGVILEELAMGVCVAITMGSINLGAVWLVRYVLERGVRFESNGVSIPNEVPIVAGPAIG